MIRLESEGGALEAVVWSEPPTLYIDTWALDRFSRDNTLRGQFLNLFKDRGTLAMSLVRPSSVPATNRRRHYVRT